MNLKKTLAATALVGVTFLGGAVGATMIGTASAATSTPSPSTSAGTGTQGRWHSNTDAAHEAGESAARAAQEKSADATGVAPEGPGGHSNTDAAHEAGESPARAAQEKAADATAGASTNG